MAAQTPKCSIRVTARIAPMALAVIQRAAALQGCSVSSFVAAAALKEARETIEAEQAMTRALMARQRLLVDDT